MVAKELMKNVQYTLVFELENNSKIKRDYFVYKNNIRGKYFLTTLVREKKKIVS